MTGSTNLWRATHKVQKYTNKRSIEICIFKKKLRMVIRGFTVRSLAFTCIILCVKLMNDRRHNAREIRLI